MYNISADFSASCREDLASAAEKCALLGLRDIDCGYVIDSVPLDEASGDETEDMRCILTDSCIRINSINMPEEKLCREKLKCFFRAAHLVRAKNIIIAAGEFTDPDRLDYLKTVCRMASAFGIRPLFENRADSALCDNSAMTLLCALIESGEAGFVFNPFEFVKRSHHPFFHMFYTSSLKNDISVLRLNDGLYNGSPAPLCEGNAEIKEMCSIMLARSFEGFFSLCPYYGSGAEGEQRYGSTLAEFKKMIKTL